MKTLINTTIIYALAVVLTAVGLTECKSKFKTIKLEGKGFDGVNYTAAFTRISGVGDMFWWFWPSFKEEATKRPLILWTEGITGDPPSVRANIETVGPIWFNLTLVPETWANKFNLLFVDSPIGTGYSKAVNPSNISTNFDDHVDYLVNVLQSFYELHKEYENTPVYLFGQAHGAQFAVALGIRLAKAKDIRCNIQGVLVGNGIISPAPSLSQLGYYLESIGATDPASRCVIDDYSNNIIQLINKKEYEKAFDLYLSIDKLVNGKGGAVSFDLTDVVLRATHEPRGIFGNRKTDRDYYDLMIEKIPPILGLPENVTYDEQRKSVVKAFRNSLMKPAIDNVECLLKDTNVTLIIYNGNQDALLNTEGQLQWVEKLNWPGQKKFLKTPRTPLILGGVLIGHVRKTPRLQFYWLKYAGQEPQRDIYLSFSRLLLQFTNTTD